MSNMKRIIWAFAILLVFFSCQSEKAGKEAVYLFSYFKGNGEDGLHLAYSTDGFHFNALNNDQSLLTPTVGSDKLMRDPCIIRDPGGKFHMVWTVSWNDKGIGYASSDDLIHWSEQKFIPVMEQEPNARNCWAPEIFYDAREALFIIFWSTTISGRYPKTEEMADKGWDHRLYYTTTTDFENFSVTKQLYNKAFNVIDGTMTENEGTYYLFMKDETRYPPQKNLRMATSQKATGPYSEASSSISGNYWAEGPTITHKGNQWIIYFDKYMEEKMGALSSTDLKTWTDISDKITFPEGTRHGSVFTLSRSEFLKLQDNLLVKKL